MKCQKCSCCCIGRLKLRNFSFTLRKEQRLRVSESRVLKNIFGPNREKVVGQRRGLLNQEPHKYLFFATYYPVFRDSKTKHSGTWLMHRGTFGTLTTIEAST